MTEVGDHGVEDRLAGLLERSAAGDGDAFSELYRATCARVFAQVLRVVRSREHAAELTQEVFVQIWRQAGRYDRATAAASAWMKTLARRRAIDRVRQVSAQTAREQQFLANHVIEDVDDVWDRVAAAAARAELQSSLTRLTPKQREAVTLAFLEGHTHAQIAALLELPLGTVKARIRDGPIRLKVTLTLN